MTVQEREQCHLYMKAAEPGIDAAANTDIAKASATGNACTNADADADANVAVQPSSSFSASASTGKLIGALAKTTVLCAVLPWPVAWGAWALGSWLWAWASGGWALLVAVYVCAAVTLGTLAVIGLAQTWWANVHVLMGFFRSNRPVLVIGPAGIAYSPASAGAFTVPWSRVLMANYLPAHEGLSQIAIGCTDESTVVTDAARQAVALRRFVVLDYLDTDASTIRQALLGYLSPGQLHGWPAEGSQAAQSAKPGLPKLTLRPLASKGRRLHAGVQRWSLFWHIVFNVVVLPVLVMLVFGSLADWLRWEWLKWLNLAAGAITAVVGLVRVPYLFTRSYALVMDDRGIALALSENGPVTVPWGRITRVEQATDADGRAEFTIHYLQGDTSDPASLTALVINPIWVDAAAHDIAAVLEDRLGPMDSVSVHTRESNTGERLAFQVAIKVLDAISSK